MINRPPPKRARRLPRILFALLLGGAAAGLVYSYVGSVQQAALRANQAAPTATPIPRTKVLVAKSDLPARTLLRPELFEERELPTEAIAPKAVTSSSDIVGKQLSAPIAVGEQLVATRLQSPSVDEPDRLSELVPPGTRAISVAFSEVLGAGGLIVPGDRVDVIATFTKDVMGKDQAMILLQNVPVLAVAQSTSPEELEPAAYGTPTAAVAPKAAAPPKTAAAPKSAPGAATKGSTPTAANGAPSAPAVALADDKVLPATPTPAAVKAAPPKTKTVTLAVAPESAERLALAEDMGNLRYVLRRTGDTDTPKVAPADLATIMSPITPASAEILAVEISPTNVKVGDSLHVKVTVKNTSDKPLQTQDPAPGYAYVQGQTYYSQQFPSEPGKWRVAVGSAGLDATELPFRWGLGGDLAPGASTTVEGEIKVIYDFKPTNFWAAVVEEPSKVVQNGAGMTMVTALPENVAVVSVDVANIRSGPSIASSVIDQMKYGTQLQIVGQSADWFKVQLPDRRQGWVAAGWIVSAGR
jgi:pilus assembly protein CpaB